MKSFFRVLITLSLSLTPVLGWTGSAEAALLVAGLENGDVLSFDDTTGEFIGIFAEGLPGDSPTSMTFGPDSNLYVGINTGAIRRYDGLTGTFIDTFASVDRSQSLITSITFGVDKNLYVTDFDGDRVVRFNGTTGAFIDNFVPTGSGGLNGPTGLTFGPDGNLYVASRISNQVLRYDSSTGAFINVFATGGNNGPQQLVFGTDNNLYLAVDGAGGNGQVLRFNGQTGSLIDTFASNIPDTTDSMSLTFGPDENLYVTSQFGDSVLRFNGTSGTFIDTFVSSGSGGLNFPTNLLFQRESVPQPVPEATTTLGLLVLGAFGVSSAMKRFRTF
ncbi:Vgb family protein [Nostoc sp. WHI]|uniref:Vgb family protein n=1 Tax=Nostoc sp. WHI TaxID=2650611 RepID=UPI0018C7E621|nr:NHL repeat-containing protein [Nostoc sp. WHI]MBG1270506.1 hypothetical protein [Nostoc sp. WHI]